ncbi:MAG: SLC13 family permease [Polyangiales bacterium]
MLVTTRRHARELLGHLNLVYHRRVLLFFVCLGLALAAFALAGAFADLALPARRTLFVLVLAASLWVTEAIPSFAVSILVIALEVLLLGEPGQHSGAAGKEWERYIRVLGHPLIWLFFGGFSLAAAASKARLDRQLAAKVLQISGTQPRSVLAGVMALTFVLSMFISNTATTAMMIAVLAPVFGGLDAKNRFGAGLLLGVCFAANIGGMGSIIGTPPNAIAVGLLADATHTNIGFGQWFLIGLPPALCLLMLTFAWIHHYFPSSEARIEVNPHADTPPAGSHTSAGRPSQLHGSSAAATRPLLRPWQRITVVFTFTATVLLWMTGGLHGLPTAAVSLLPIVVFTGTGVLTAVEIRGLSWDVLLLIAGGLSLGVAISTTGLATWIVTHLPLSGLPKMALAFALAYLCITLANFMSHTAAANVLVPIAIALAPGGEAALALPTALAASAAAALPISTPPNAIAFSHGLIHIKDMLRLGIVLAIIAPAMAVLWSEFVLPLVLHTQ